MFKNNVEALRFLTNYLKTNLNNEIEKLNNEYKILQKIDDYYNYFNIMPNKTIFLNAFCSKNEYRQNGNVGASVLELVFEIIKKRKAVNNNDEYMASLLYVEAMKAVFESLSIKLGLEIEEVMPFDIELGAGNQFLISSLKVSIIY